MIEIKNRVDKNLNHALTIGQKDATKCTSGNKNYTGRDIMTPLYLIIIISDM